MAYDPIIGEGFTPSIQVNPTSRRPKTAAGVNSEWDLEGVVPHGGNAGELGQSNLVANERVVLRVLVQTQPATWGEYSDCVARCGALDFEYWAASLLVKLQVSNLPDLLAAVDNQSELLDNPAPAVPMDSGLIGGNLIVGPQG